MKRISYKILSSVLLIVFLIGLMIAKYPTIEVQAASNEQTIYEYLIKDLGFNTAAACGVLANIEKESGFRPDLMEKGYTWDQGAGYGICQWTNYPRTSGTGRRTNLVNWCSSNGYDYKSPESVKLSKQQSAAPVPKRYSPRRCFC